MIRKALIAGLIVSTPALAEDSDARAVIIAVFESSECRLKKSEMRKAFRKADIDPNLSGSTVTRLFNEGALKFERQSKRVVLQVGDVCSDVEVATEILNPLTLMAVIAAYGRNDCQLLLNGNELRALERQFSKASYDAVMGHLINTNGLLYAEGPTNMSVLTIGPVCGPKAE